MFWAFLAPALIVSGIILVILIGIAAVALLGAPSNPGPMDEDEP